MDWSLALKNNVTSEELQEDLNWRFTELKQFNIEAVYAMEKGFGTTSKP